jgi:hypothetical protein
MSLFNRFWARNTQPRQNGSPNSQAPDRASNRDLAKDEALRWLTNTPTEEFLAHRHEINTPG